LGGVLRGVQRVGARAISVCCMALLTHHCVGMENSKACTPSGVVAVAGLVGLDAFQGQVDAPTCCHTVIKERSSTGPNINQPCSAELRYWQCPSCKQSCTCQRLGYQPSPNRVSVASALVAQFAFWHFYTSDPFCFFLHGFGLGNTQAPLALLSC
jgi:hypothetical protein